MVHVTKVAAVMMSRILLDCMVEWLILIKGMLLIMLDRIYKESIFVMWVLLLGLIVLMQLGVVNVVVFNAMNSLSLQIMEKLVKLVLDIRHHTSAFDLISVMR